MFTFIVIFNTFGVYSSFGKNDNKHLAVKNTLNNSIKSNIKEKSLKVQKGEEKEKIQKTKEEESEKEKDEDLNQDSLKINIEENRNYSGFYFV